MRYKASNVNRRDQFSRKGNSRLEAGTKLKSKSPDWNGADEFAFSALPGGYRSTDGTFGDLGAGGDWWTATEGGASYAYYRSMLTGYSDVIEINGNKGNGCSVRCVQD
jgi:uncharacterized protein (TIGR02145 family)